MNTLLHLLSLLLLCIAAASPALAQQAPARHALIIGINRYASATIRPLHGCVSDARRVQKTAKEQWGFTDEPKIKLLTNELATRQAIVSAFHKHLIQKCAKQDVALIFFAGHGSQVQDWSGDELDGADEIICPHDIDLDDASTYITDDQIQELVKALAKKCDNVILIFDSCNSGTASLVVAGAADSGEREIFNPDPELRKLTDSNFASNTLDHERYPQNHLLISACLPSEKSKELAGIGGLGPDITSGVFTTHLALQAAKGPLSPDSFATIRQEVTKTLQNASKPPQTPQLYGDLKLLEKLKP